MTNDKLILESKTENKASKSFCEKFINSKDQPKYLFGRNVYADDIVKNIEIDGFIDDFTTETLFLNKPIVTLNQIPQNSLIVVLSGGRPLSALKRVREAGFESLDYFSFYKYADLPLLEAVFNENFEYEFKMNQSKFESVYRLLNDDISKEQFSKLINFRFTYDIDFLKGFQFLEDKQYFEDFLALKTDAETFVDVGGFDGYTSQEFIKLCPGYKAVHIFEPEEKNINLAKQRLESFENIHFHQLGLSDKKQTLKFDVGGSSSKITDEGSITIEVDRLDDLLNEPVTFLKMDIEGAEEDAIEGAKETIRTYHPTLAISVYHKPSDFWKIPEQIFSIRDDYTLYLRHYTESIYETVMFFIPSKEKPE